MLFNVNHQYSHNHQKTFTVLNKNIFHEYDPFAYRKSLLLLNLTSISNRMCQCIFLQYGDPPLHTTARYNRISLLPYLLAPPNYRTLWVERRKKKLTNALEFEEEKRLAEARYHSLKHFKHRPNQ